VREAQRHDFEQNDFLMYGLWLISTPHCLQFVMTFFLVSGLPISCLTASIVVQSSVDIVNHIHLPKSTKIIYNLIYFLGKRKAPMKGLRIITYLA
jgi:hypothetical protein